jgi:hypothetical protein
MHLLTVCNKRTLGLDLWEDTARLQGLVPKVLGIGDKRDLGHESKRFGLKFVLLAQHLRTLDASELCLVTDGYDVVFHNCSNLQAVLEHLPPHMLAFAGDVFENPDKGGPYTTRHLRVPYLNSGVYAGRAGTILEVLDAALRQKDPFDLDDQRYFTQYMFANPQRIFIDHECKVFVCMAGLESRDYAVKEGKLVVFGSSYPSVIHFQGYYKDTSILKDLYPADKRVQALAKHLHRFPGACSREIGDYAKRVVTRIGSNLPVPPKYSIHAAILVLVLTLLLIVLGLMS